VVNDRETVSSPWAKSRITIRSLCPAVKRWQQLLRRATADNDCSGAKMGHLGWNFTYSKNLDFD